MYICMVGWADKKCSVPFAMSMLEIEGKRSTEHSGRWIYGCF